MCHNIIKHSFNENIKELIRLFVNFILKWKIEIFYTFSTPRIFHTPHFPHSAFSTEPLGSVSHFSALQFAKIFWLPNLRFQMLCDLGLNLAFRYLWVRRRLPKLNFSHSSIAASCTLTYTICKVRKFYFRIYKYNFIILI